MPVRQEDVFSLDLGDVQVTDVGAALRAHAAANPDAVALAMVGSEEWSYRTLDGRARSIAAHLGGRGSEGDRVLLLLDAGLEFVATFFGCLYAGLVPVPVGFRVGDGTSAAIRGIVRDARPLLAVVNSEAMENPQAAAVFDAAGLETVTVGDIPDKPSAWTGEPLADPAGGLAFLQYTSGSTSSPKGVMVSHGNLLHNIGMIRDAFGFDAQSTMVSWLPHNHDMGLIGTILTPVVLGVPTVLMTPTNFVRRPSAWLRAISDYSGTISGGPNFAYDLCAARIQDDELDGVDLSRWKVAFNGAEPVRASTIASFARRFAGHGFNPQAMLPCYGLAEATLLVAGDMRSEARSGRFDRAALETGQAQPAARGQADTVALVPHAVLPGSEVLIADEAGKPLPDGRIGEVWIRSQSVAAGYWHQPEQTVATFGAVPAGSAGGAYLRSGDLGFRMGDELYIRGRAKDVVIVRGRNIYLADVEAALRSALGERVAAFRISDSGEERDEAVGVAYEVSPARSSHEELAEKARAIATEKLGIELHDVVPLRKRGIPMTTSGKIRRSQCAADYAAGVLPRADGGDGISPGAAPAASGRLRSITAKLAAMGYGAAGSADPQTPLSGLGVDSLKAIEFQQWLEQAHGLRLGLGEIFASSLGELAGRRSERSGPGILAPSDELSYGQEAIWLQGKMAPDASAMLLSRALDLVGPLDPDALRRAAQAVAVRHAALRTRFIERSGHLRREIAAEGADVQVVDAAALTGQQVQQLAAQYAARPIALDSGRLLRAVLLRRGPERHLLVLSTHHIAMDVWSLSVLFRELAGAYLEESGARPRGTAALAGPDGAADYGEFVAEQRQTAAASAGSDLEARWRQRLAGVPAALLPADSARPRVRAFRGAERRFTLTRSEHDDLVSAAAKCDVSPATFLCGVYAITLQRLNGQDEFVLGYVSAGRHRAKFRDTIGYFVNALPVPARLRADASVAELMRALDSEIRACTDDGELPLAKIIDAVSAARSDGSTPPLVSTCFAYQRAPGTEDLGLTPLILNYPGAVGSWGGVSVAAVELPQETSYFDLSLYLGEHEGQITGRWNFDTELFDGRTIEAFSEVFSGLVRQACRDVNGPVLALRPAAGPALLPAVGSPGPGLADTCVHTLFEQQAQRVPDWPAVIFGEEVLTYRELNLRANRVAHRLISEGIGSEDRVGLLTGRTANSIAAIFGVLKAGAAYVPLDPGYPRERLEFVAADAGIKVLLADVGMPELGVEPVLSLPELTAAGEPGADANPAGRARPGNAAYLVYTSGSTGRPNGVIGLHQGIVSRNQAILDRFPLAPDEVCCHKTAQSYFDSGGEIFLPLIAGVPTVVVPDETGRDPARLADLLERQRVTRLVAVPSLLASVLEAVPEAGRQLRHLRYCHSSGESLSAELAGRLRNALPDCTLVDLYGSSETSADATLQVLDVRTPAGTVGSALPGMRVYVLGPDGDRQPPLFPGEVFVGGVGLNRGYAGHPDLTAAKFVPDPYGTPGSRMFATGDRGRMTADGRLQYLGRADDQVKIRGHRVEFGEIDAVIGAHPQVSAALTGVRAVRGNGPQLVTAVVLRESEAAADEASRATRISEWYRLYERLYSDGGPSPERGVWTSSVTGEPFSREELDEWLGAAVSVIGELRPRRILDIGCGDGNLLTRLPDGVEHYVGTDFSPAAVELLRECGAHVQAARPGAGLVVDARVARADEPLPYPPQTFDLVVVNSVTQYLPGHDYVLEVLRQAVGMTRPGGAVLVGDVRDLGLFRLFHEEVARGRLGTGASRDDVASWARDHMRLDKELLLAPDFFLDAAQMLGRVRSVELRHKRGRLHNELSRYRFNAVLRVEGSYPQARRLAATHAWPYGDDAAAAAGGRLRELLRAAAGPVEVRDVPNGRLGPGVDPEDAWLAAEGTGYAVAVSLASSRDPLRMDLRYWPADSDHGDHVWSDLPRLPGSWADRANAPLTQASQAGRVAEVRDHARRFLPPYAIPVIEIVDRIPTTDTGKGSRRAVGSAPPRARPAGGEPAPTTTAQLVSAAWREVLESDSIPLDENFFDLGGHSLSLVRVHVRLQEVLGREFPLVDLYEYTTVRRIADYLEGLSADSAAAADTAAARRTAVRSRRDIIRAARTDG